MAVQQVRASAPAPLAAAPPAQAAGLRVGRPTFRDEVEDVRARRRSAESVFAGAGSCVQSRDVLARGAQALPLVPLCAPARLVTRVCAMTSAVVAGLVCDMLLARMSAGQ